MVNPDSGVLMLDWFIETGQSMMETFRKIVEFLMLEITIDGSALNQLWEQLFSVAAPFPAEPFNISFWSLMFGEAIICYILFSGVKYLLDIVL